MERPAKAPAHSDDGSCPEAQRTLAGLLNKLPAITYRCELDPDWTLKFIGGGCYKLSGFRPRDFMPGGKASFFEIIHPEDRPAVWKQVKESLVKRRLFEIEYRIRTANGREKWVWNQGYGIPDTRGKIYAIEGFAIEVTRRHRASTLLQETGAYARTPQLRGARANSAAPARPRPATPAAAHPALDSEQHFRSVADTAPVMIWTSNTEAVCNFFNTAWLAFTGRTLEQETNHGWAQGVHPMDLPACVESYLAAFKQRQPWSREYRLRRADGAYRWVLDSGMPRYRPDGAFLGYIGACIDITERKQLEEQILQISEREQQRIGQDLHDGLCQLLTGLKFRCSLILRKLQDQRLTEAREARVVAQLLDQALREARSLATGLQPLSLEPDSLMKALDSLARNMRAFYGIRCRCRCPKPVFLTDPAVAVHLYRIAQEALNNARHHGRARRTWIELLAAKNLLTLSVRDDGAGFRRKLRKRGGLGLQIMGYRARMIGGSLTIQPLARGGTRVVCTLPNPPLARSHNGHSGKIPARHAKAQDPPAG